MYHMIPTDLPSLRCLHSSEAACPAARRNG